MPKDKGFFGDSVVQGVYDLRIMCDHIPHELMPLDAGYVVCCLPENHDSPLNRAAEAWRHGIVEQLMVLDFRSGENGVFINTDGRVGYAGRDAYCKELAERSVDLAKISVCPLNGSFNTFTEACAVIDYAKACDWRTLAIFAFPAHMRRVVASFVTAAKLRGWSGKPYFIVGTPLRWDERVWHSNGTGAIPRVASIGKEKERLNSYVLEPGYVLGEHVLVPGWKHGNLLPAHEILEFLDQRDIEPLRH